MSGLGVRVGAEIPYALELERLPDGSLPKRRFQIASGDDHRIGVEIVLPTAAFGHVVGIFGREKRVEEPDFGFDRIGRRYPVDHAFHAAAVARRTVARLRVVRAAKLRDVAFCILDDLFASDQVGVAQAHLRTGTQAVVFLGRDLILEES